MIGLTGTLPPGAHTLGDGLAGPHNGRERERRSGRYRRWLDHSAEQGLSPSPKPLALPGHVPGGTHGPGSSRCPGMLDSGRLISHSGAGPCARGLPALWVISRAGVSCGSGNSLGLRSQALPWLGSNCVTPRGREGKSGEHPELGAERLGPATGKGPGGRLLSGAARDLHLEERTDLGRGPSLPASCPGAAELRGDLLGTLLFPGPEFSRRYTQRGGGSFQINAAVPSVSWAGQPGSGDWGENWSHTAAPWEVS